MRDAMDLQLWVNHHDSFSADLGRRLSRLSARLRAGSGDPVPIVGKALAMVLAVSLASLSLGSAVA